MKFSYIALLPGVQLKKPLGIQAEVLQPESRVNAQYEPLNNQQSLQRGFSQPVTDSGFSQKAG